VEDDAAGGFNVSVTRLKFWAEVVDLLYSEAMCVESLQQRVVQLSTFVASIFASQWLQRNLTVVVRREPVVREDRIRCGDRPYTVIEDNHGHASIR